ncbi:UPF0554 protein C2orf43-like protein [Smittium mucronatum]|uniref:UPF0554 protein C2orf43-like protein n=1 Tax=Smittium mucronatum TaxID=133383 RepID=A0A1R0GRC6_9FUNG|nr:UPF0554 protein C2orf43-like protein [Smittium mucronatum]
MWIVSLQGHSIYEDELGQLVEPDRIEYQQSSVPDPPKFLLCGHSVGSYICEQSFGFSNKNKNFNFLYEKVFKSSRESVYRVIYLFPTVMDIAKTPNGADLKLLFNPVSISLVSNMVGFLRYLFGPASLKYLISLRESNMPTHLGNMFAYKSLSRSTVSNFLNMAKQEMHTITALDSSFYQEFGHLFFMYYGTSDRWVPLDQYESMKQINTRGTTIQPKQQKSSIRTSSHYRYLSFRPTLPFFSLIPQLISA